MMDTQTLDKYANRTISANAFLAIVERRLRDGLPLSVVRMGDGERQLFEDTKSAIDNGRGGLTVQYMTEDWRTRMGIQGITNKMLLEIMSQAITETEYYCPSVSGFTNNNYNLYPWLEYAEGAQAPFKKLADNFWCNLATDEQRIRIYKAARHVLFIHRNRACYDAFARRARKYLALESTHVELSNWQQATNVRNLARDMDWNLALVSAGPASKWIIPQLAEKGRVVLDLGNAMDHWTLSGLEKA